MWTADVKDFSSQTHALSASPLICSTYHHSLPMFAVFSCFYVNAQAYFVPLESPVHFPTFPRVCATSQNGFLKAFTPTLAAKDCAKHLQQCLFLLVFDTDDDMSDNILLTCKRPFASPHRPCRCC